MADRAVYVRFTRTEGGGTRLVATRGYTGPEVARLDFHRILSPAEEHELDHAVRAGAASAEEAKS